MILDCLLGEEVLKLFQLSGILRGEIVGLAEVLGYMVKFPSVLGERRKRHHQPGNGMTRACHPAIVINSAVSKHLKILSRMCFFSFGIVERINHRCSVERSLRRSVDALRKRQADCLQYSRRNVSNMSELRADFSLGFNSRRPMDNDSVRSAAVMRSDLLGPLKRRITSPSPADSVMWKGRWVAPVIQMRHVNFGGIDDAIQRHHFVIGAFRSALGTGTVIANNVNEQCVIHHAHFLQGIDQASYLFVSVLGKASEGLHLPGLKFFLVGSLRVPGGNFLRTLDRKSVV